MMANRNNNYKDNEMETFLYAMERNYVKVCKSSSLDACEKSKIWGDITNEVNAVSTITREPEKLMKKWRDFTSRARCKLKDGRALNRHEQKALAIMENVSAVCDMQNTDDIRTTDDLSSEHPQQPECSTSHANKHFTPDEVDILVNMVTKHKSTLFGSFSNVVTREIKEKLWEEITSDINSISPAERSKEKVKESGAAFKVRSNLRQLQSTERKEPPA